MLPREDQISLEQVALFVRTAPSELGIPDTAQVRSVLLQRVDGRWINHCTVLKLGASNGPPSDDVQDRRVGAARVIGSECSAAAIADRGLLIDALTVWGVALPLGFLGMLDKSPFGSAVEERPWNFQESANLYHHGSGNPWGKPPCWDVNVFDRQNSSQGFVAPRGPFRDLETGSFAPTLGALVKNWCSDPSLRESTTIQNAYRILVPDCRAYFEDVNIRNHTLEIVVGGTRRSDLECALTAWDRHRNDTTKKSSVSDGRVTFNLPSDAVSFELYLLDDSEAWCDRHFRGDLATPEPFAEAAAEERTPQAVSHPLLQQLLAPRYAGPHEHFSKALAYNAGPSLDLANAAKEAVCAVESLGRIVTAHHSWTLGEVIKGLKKQGKLDPAIAQAFEGLWGFTSNAPGVRHGGATPPTITASDTQLAIEMSAAAIQYLLKLDA